MRPYLTPMLLSVAFALAACDRDTGETADDETPEGTAAFSVHPAVGGQGVAGLRVRVEASRSVFEFGDTTVDLGEGVTVTSLEVEDGYNAVATVDIAPDAALGERDVVVGIKDTDSTIAGGFSVIAESFVVDPGSAKMGETVDVAIVGTATEWTDGYTWGGFGQDVTVLDFSVLSETLASARIAVHPNARPGPRDVHMESGPDVVTLYDGFLVDRAVITAVFDPPTGYQGDTVEFTIHGLDTDFVSSTEIEFWDDGGENADIQITQLTVLGPDEMWGKMRLSNAARLGMRDVLIRYDDEAVLVPDAFEVLDAPPDLSDVYVGLQFDVNRSIDNSTGAIAESVIAMAYFLIPLDPPCGASPPQGQGPQPYDANGVFEVPPEAEPVDCPNPETVSAGDYVWFESPLNVVTLDKEVIASTGQIIYYGNNLTLADYGFDQLYDLHTQGDPDGIPEVLLPEVQPTVPADYYLLTPDFWGDLTIDRTQDFEYTWTPAETYPDAFFITQISGVLESNGEGGFAGSIPWDDGTHTYKASELSQLQATPASFAAVSYIEGPDFGLPFSTIQNCKSDSSLTTSAYVILE